MENHLKFLGGRLKYYILAFMTQFIIFKLFEVYFYFMCMHVCEHLCSAHVSQKRASDPLDLELPDDSELPEVGAGN